MALDVNVKISLIQPVGIVGFGVPLILEENASTSVEYTECSSLAEVLTAGFTESTKTYKAAKALLVQENAPAKFVVCATTESAETWLGDVKNTTKEWRQLIIVSNSETATNISGVMSAIEDLENKLYFADLAISDKTELTVKESTRTVLFYCDGTDEYPVPSAALVGATAGLSAGSFTYKNMILKGLKPQALTDAEINAIHEKGGLTFVTKAGDNVTSEGKVAGGEYIDIIDSKDYVISQLEYRTQKLLNSSLKIPYDNTGIALLQSVCEDVLRDAYNNGIIATDEEGAPAYNVSYAIKEAMSEEDRAARKYIGGSFSFTLAGAVHLVEVNGTIEI